MTFYPPRIRKFRDGLIRELPRAPMNRASLAQVEAMPTRRLILAHLTWRTRFVPARPRRVTVWAGSMTPDAFRAIEPEMAGLLADVRSGADLTPRLSTDVETKGIVLAGAKPGDKGRDLDSVLIRLGLHHFHLGAISPENPRGRSGKLVFAEVSADEFRIVAVAGHDAFENGEPGHAAFMKLCRSYLSRELGPGEGFMLHPCMSSGHPLVATVFADRCENLMEVEDPALDDPATVDLLYSILADAAPKDGVPRPKKPSLVWHLHDLQFGILDRKTETFFSRLTFAAR